jgi:hypothetical protein
MEQKAKDRSENQCRFGSIVREMEAKEERGGRVTLEGARLKFNDSFARLLARLEESGPPVLTRGERLRQEEERETSGDWEEETVVVAVLVDGELEVELEVEVARPGAGGKRR